MTLNSNRKTAAHLIHLIANRNGNIPNVGVQARHEEKMVAVTVYFWTTNIASVKGNILPKQCHSSGIVMVNANGSHGITSGNRKYMFRSLEDIPNLIEEALGNAGVEMR